MIAVAARLAPRVLRALHWTPLFVAAVAGPALALLVALLAPGPAGPGGALWMLRATAVLLAAAAGFALADEMADATGATPTPRWLRQWLRTALAVPPLAAGWVLTRAVIVTQWSDGSAVALRDALLEAIVLVGVGLVCAGMAVRWDPDRQGAIVGMGVFAVLWVGSLLVPDAWSPWPSPLDPRGAAERAAWWWALPLVVTLLGVAHRDRR